MKGKAGSFIGVITDGWELLDLLADCVDCWPMLLIVGGVCLIHLILTGSGGGVS